MGQPVIAIFGIAILEPVTTLTDVLASAVCFLAFVRLVAMARRDRERGEHTMNRALLFIRYYFLLMGIATLIGGVIGHGFLYLFSFAWKLPGWITSMVAIMLLERASIEQLKPYISARFLRALRMVNIVELLIFMTLTFATLNFRFVEIHSAYGILVVVGSLQLFALRRGAGTAPRIFLHAIGWAILSGVAYLGEVRLSIWFNHYDLSHTLMAISNWVFFVGAAKLRCVPAESGAAPDGTETAAPMRS